MHGLSIDAYKNVFFNTLTTAFFASVTYFFTVVFESKVKPGRLIVIDELALLNSIIAGLVASSAGCAYVSNFGAAVIGVMAGLIYSFSARVFKRFEIDDPIEVASTHLTNGIWGVISVGFWHTELGLFYAGKRD
jgi:Amt family ammonium transporter